MYLMGGVCVCVCVRARAYVDAMEDVCVYVCVCARALGREQEQTDERQSKNKLMRDRARTNLSCDRASTTFERESKNKLLRDTNS